jgi:hypothetical protein
MNGEVQLIVKVAGTAPSGIVTATESGVINDSVNPQQVFSYPNDMSAYVGGYVQIQSLTFGDLGTYYISGVDINNPALSYVSANNTQIFTTFPWNFNVGGADLPNFNYMEAIPSTTDVYLDLFENESISQNWRFTDLNNFQSLGAFSREFRVPFSTRNQSALGALFDVNVDAGSANFFHYKLPAEIRVDTLPIASGYIRVRKVYKQQGKINEVELAFYAETPDLVKKIGEKKLKDIADLPTLNEVVQYSNVTNPSADRIWTIVDKGQLWSEGGEPNTRPLTNSTRPVYASDLTPALNWWYLFSNIIADAGFELEAGSLENIINQYWMPWCNSQRLIASDTFNALFFTAQTSVDNPISYFPNGTVVQFNNEIFDNGGDYNPATFTYTTPSAGYYTFQVVLNIQSQSSGQGESILNVGLLVDGVVIPNLANVSYPQDFPNYYERIFTFTAGIDAGSQVKLLVFIGNSILDLVSINGTWSLTSVRLNYDQTIYYDLNAPDVKQLDFVNDVIKMHNCAIIPDRTNPFKVSIVPQNSYLGSGTTLDWTKKLDISKDVVMYSTVELQKSKFQFTYTLGEDFLSQVYKNVNRIYGDYEQVGYTINPDTEPSDFITGDQKIQLTTQSTPGGVVVGSGVVMPMFYNNSGEFVAPGARCLFEAGTANIQLFDDGALTSVLEPVPLLNHYSQVLADIDDYDLNWAPEIPPHPIVTNPYNNLFNLYWRSYMNALYSPEARIMEASFALDLKDILTFSFADKIWINDSYWRILEINDYKVGMNESTSVKLIKFLEGVEDCSSTPSSVSVNGEVNFVDANGDPVAATQDCCQRYGYDWDETEAICWAFTPTGDRPLAGTVGGKTNPSPRVSKTAIQTRSISNSVIDGETIAIELGNRDMLAVGTDLTLNKDVQGSNLLGKNVTTNLPGIHIGGGYRDGDPTNIYYGWAQCGTFVLQKQITIATSGDVFDLDIEGRSGEYIDMPDDTVWSCLLNVTIKDAAGAYETSLHHFTLDKFAAVANASAITTLSTIGSIGANVFTFGIDTTTDPAQHRINVTVTGGTYPENFIITASLQYQQSKTT